MPLSIRMQDVNRGLLTNADFDILTIPGGYAEGYKTGMDGHEQNIRDFIRAVGDFYGISAGGFYAAGTL